MTVMAVISKKSLDKALEDEDSICNDHAEIIISGLEWYQLRWIVKPIIEVTPAPAILHHEYARKPGNKKKDNFNMLWHMRYSHLDAINLAHAVEVMDDVPQIKVSNDTFHECKMYIKFKLTWKS